MDPNQLNESLITLTLKVKDVNLILELLGDQPLKKVLDLFVTLRQQGDQAVVQLENSPATG